MEVGQQAWILKNVEESGIEVPRFEGRQTQPLDTGITQDSCDEVEKPPLVPKIPHTCGITRKREDHE